MNAELPNAEQQVVDRLQDRVRGLLLGLALGDALAAPVQFRRAGTFSRVADMLGGGPYDLPRGAWSDDAATALICAQCATETESPGIEEILQRWSSWQREGIGSSTGQCLGISAAMTAAVTGASHTGVAANPQAEPLPRAAVMAAASFLDIEQAADLAAAVAKLTHPQPAVVSSARQFARVTVLALEGVPKENLFATASTMMPERGGFDGEDADASEAAELLRNAATRGDAPSVLRLSRWVLLSTSTYKEAVLSAINAGGHADVIGATVGALAGAVYGARSLPPHWLQSLHARDRIETLADQLLATALARILEEPGTATA